MANPKWFDADVYMQNKLVQMQASDPAYTMTDLVDAFAKAGYVGPEGYYAHFVQYGADEDVAPNAFFNAQEYYTAKAAQYYGEAFTGSELQVAEVKALIQAADMNAWTHYQQYGSAEGVDPSNAFDASAYCAAKALAMNDAGLKDAAGNDWTADSIKTAIDQAGMSVLEHYLTYAGTGEGEVASGATYPVADDDQVVVPNPGVNILVSESETSYNGTAGDDSFYMQGTAELQAYHTLDGGEGNDTLILNGKDLGGATIRNIENLVVNTGAGDAYDMNTFSTSFTLNGGTATVENVVSQKLIADGATSLTVNMAAGQTSVDLTSQNRSADQSVVLSGDSLTSVKLAVDEGAKKVAFTGSDAKVTDLAITAAVSDAEDDAAAVDVDGLAELTNITVAGAGAVELTVDAAKDALKTVNATDNTGGVTVNLSEADKAAFTGGAGDDTLTVNGSTVAHTLGAGDDTVVVDDADVTQLEKGFSVDGGDGEDTLVMSATNAGKMTSDIFKAFTGFEVLGLNDGEGTIKLDSFGDINQVTIAKALSGEVTIENMDSNGTLEFNAAAGQNITVKVTDAEKEGNITDVLNVKLSAAGDIDNAASDKALTVANVETINIEADDADDDGDAAHTLKLTAEGAKTVNVTGDADLTLSGTFAAGATIDISTNTADVTFTANKIDSSKVTDENTLVTLKGFTDGDTINIADANSNSFGAKVELGANSTIQDYLTAASSQSGNAAWFEFGGDTYILFDANNTLDTDDYIVKLAGTDYDLKGLSFSSTGDLTLPEGA
ncbi:hypothetical protein [Desulfovibrio piger]|uniref:hypothetical protein n=1 Tax=Desulfovibrio piger TaxID=901 RepID=UPI0039F607C4